MVRVTLIMFSIGIILSDIKCSRRFCKRNNAPYENHTLLELTPKNEHQLKVLKNLNDIDPEIDIFKYSTGILNSLEVLVPPNKLKVINKFAQKHKIKLQVKTSNYGRYMDANIANYSTKLLSSNLVFHFNSYTNIRSLYKNTAAKYPELMQVEFLGKSFEGRKMELVKISKNPDANNPIIFVDAGIHAREWVAPATAVYFIHQLVAPENAADLDNVDYYILPVVNPDGYEFSRTNKRMWRKTRSKRMNSKCTGADGNRNYGYKWATINAVNDPCNFATYVGQNAFSEKEIKIVRNVMKKYLDRIKLYLTLHCYGQLILYPWGWDTKEKPENLDRLHSLAVRAEKAMVEAGAKPFKCMSAAELYITSGSSTDYAYHLGIPYAYAIELTDGYEFDFPESKLPSALPPFYKGLQTFAHHIREEYASTFKLRHKHKNKTRPSSQLA